jgi:hypothetical protein
MDKPLNRLSPEDRYLRDPWFHNLVDLIRVQLLGGGQFTPTEVREAAILACTMHEQRRPAMPIYIGPDDHWKRGGGGG